MVKHYVSVRNTQDFGFWEIDTEKYTVNLRKKSFVIPKDEKLERLEDFYNNIEDYINQKFDNTVYVREVLKDRKYIFSDKLFCAKCTNTAFVINDENNPLCKEHMDFKIH